MIVRTGVPAEDAKVQLCHAIADDALPIRVMIWGVGVSGQTLERPMVDAPKYLRPADIDWGNSRPKRPWRTRAKGYFAVTEEPRPIVFVEVKAARVIEIWNCGESARSEVSPISAHGTQTREEWSARVEPHAVSADTDALATARLAIPNKPGSGGRKLAGAIQAMIEAVQSGQVSGADLQRLKQKELQRLYPRAGRTTLVRARELALAHIGVTLPANLPA
jgi:hypothetical protein